MPFRTVVFQLAVWLAVGLTLAGCRRLDRPSQPARPNIVVILADDMGYSDIGSYGGEIPTPNLDRMASGGLRFANFYNTARCCPTRASLLTGLYSHQAGIGHMTEDFGHPSYRGYLNDRSLTLAEALRSAGYGTYMVGKWHVGGERGQWPLDRGFDRFYGIPAGGGVYFWPGRVDREVVLDTTVVTPGEGWYSTDAFSDYATRFIEEGSRSGKPFFLYLAYIAPHFPLQAPEEDVKRFEGTYSNGWDELRRARFERQKEMGLLPLTAKLSERDPDSRPWADASDKKGWDRKMAVYAAMMHRMDEGIGRVLGKLDELGIDDNTLVVFLSDNGGSAETVDRSAPGALPGHPDSFVSYGLPWANLSNTPYRRYKMVVQEGGIVTPFIAYWPGTIRPGGITRQVGHVIDLMPTVLDLAGITYPDERNGETLVPLEGRSLLDAFRGEPAASRGPFFWEHEGNRAVRVGDWKLVASQGEAWELYDLASDPTEMHDLAGRRPEKVAELAAVYAGWAERVGALPWEDVRKLRADR